MPQLIGTIKCPQCGNEAAVTEPPFTYNNQEDTLHPSLRFPCGWHGYYVKGEFVNKQGDSCCQGNMNQPEKFKVEP